MNNDKPPSAPRAPEGGKTTVRERILTHMEYLLRNATKLGAGIALVCGFAAQGCKRVWIDAIPPLPPPGVCENPDPSLLSISINRIAQWEKSGRKWTIVLNVNVVSGESRIWFGWLKKEDVQVSGASVTSMSVEPQNVEFRLVPVKGKGEVELWLTVLCDQKQVPLHVKLDLSKPRKKKGYIPAELVK